MSITINSLSVEVLEMVLVQILDYSVFINNRQLKRISLVCKSWSEIARRLLVREIHITDEDALWGLREVLRKDPKLALLIRSISFGSPGSPVASRDDDGVAQDSSLLALAELCTEYNIGRVTLHISVVTGKNAICKPKFPMSKRLLHLQYPTIVKPSGDPFSNNIIFPLSASSALRRSANTITHLVIEGTEMKDFDDDHDGVDGPPEERFPNLTDITFLNLDIGVGWIVSLFLYRDQIGRLKRLNLHNVTNSEILGRLLRKGGAAGCLEELTWFDSEEEPISDDIRAIVTSFKRLTHLSYDFKSSRLFRKIPRYIFKLPPTLRQITLAVGDLFPHAFKLLQHLSTSTRHDIRSIAIQGGQKPIRTQNFPSLSVRPITPLLPFEGLDNRKTSTVQQLRLCHTRIELQNLRDSLTLLGPSLQYLALDSIECLPPFDLIQSSCQDLRWLELGSVYEVWNQVNNPDPEVDLWWDDEDADDSEGIIEELEVESQTKDTHYTDQDVDYQSEAFSTLSLPHLDYLYINLESLISLESINDSISKGRFPNLKVLDIDGLTDPGSCNFGMDKKRILEGFEVLVVTCKERGITLASEGKPIETFGDLWWHLAARPARKGEDED